MGRLRDLLFGKSKLPPSRKENLAAMKTAGVVMQKQHGMDPLGKAAVAFRPMASSSFDETRQEMDRDLRTAEATAGTAYALSTDEYGYVWVVLQDTDFEDLVSGVQRVSETLLARNLEDRLLAAVFAFTSDRGGGAFYWVYAYKHGLFYPFAPAGDHQRDNVLEMRQAALLSDDLPVQWETAKWFAFWGIPM